jgi:hypothetical protein
MAAYASLAARCCAPGRVNYFVYAGGVGEARVFTRSGSTWTQQGEKLTGGDYPVTDLASGALAARCPGMAAPR